MACKDLEAAIACVCRQFDSRESAGETGLAVSFNPEHDACLKKTLSSHSENNDCYPCMIADLTITHYVLNFSSSCVTLVLGFLLLGVRIPKQEVLKNLRTARNFLSGAYFVLAGSGFISYFMHVEAEKDAVLMATTLFIASYQAFLFTMTCITFIHPAWVKRPFIVKHLLAITVVGVPLFLISLLAEESAFFIAFYFCIALYILQLLRYVYLFRREYGRSLKQLEAYYDEDENHRLQWVKVCFYSALGIGLWALASLFSGDLLFCLFIVAYTAYYAANRQNRGTDGCALCSSGNLLGG